MGTASSLLSYSAALAYELRLAAYPRCLPEWRAAALRVGLVGRTRSLAAHLLLLVLLRGVGLPMRTRRVQRYPQGSFEMM